jgi:hypothetical protein
LLVKFARFINKTAHGLIDYSQYNFKYIVNKVYDGTMICFRKLEDFIQYAWRGIEYKIAILIGNDNLKLRSNEWYLQTIGV